MKIHAIHLLNDYSGSPKVLKQLINGWIKNDMEVSLFTNQNKTGFLSNIKGSKFYPVWYKSGSNKLLKLINLVISQLLLFFQLLKTTQKEDLIYINTVLPFGAAMAGKIKGNRIIYHIHETSITPILFKKFLFFIVKWAATEVVYVSKFIANQEPIKVKSYILYNAIETEFLDKAIKKRKVKTEMNNVLMVCSLKDYKGINEFIVLAKANPYFNFKLVLNASKQEIDTYFKNTQIPKNCLIYHTQTNLHPFYQWASVILNLSRPNEWVETFGLTIIEGMSYGLPAIVPPVGGITELVKENYNGFLVDCRNFNELNDKLEVLLNQEKNYQLMSANASTKINEFSENVFINKSLEIINNLNS